MADFGFSACCCQMIAQCTTKAVWPHIRYIFCYRGNIEDLKIEVTQLTVKQSGVQTRIEEAKRNGDKILPDVEKWMEEVNTIIGEAEQIWEAEESESKAGCLNLKLRYRFGKRAKEKTQEVAKVRGIGGDFTTTISYREAPERRITGKSNDGLESRKSVVNQIMEALKDPNVKMIGLSGPGGVGKTTIAEQVEKMFGNAIMAKVTDHPNISEIQQVIAEKLGMERLETTEDARAGRLHDRLKQGTDMRLIILDDLWKYLDLRKIGIPDPLDGDTKIKILLTSRDYGLLSGEMNCGFSIKVPVLSDDEAWELFTKEIVELPNDSDIHTVAEKIVGRCGGLPLLIVTMARTLRKKNLDVWKHALQQLENPSQQRDIRGIEDAYSVLKVSYDNLPSKKTQLIFLLCAILSHDPQVIDLYMCSVGLGLLQDGNSMEQDLVEINSLISQLKDSNLLLDSPSILRFAIHDVFRDVALSIACNEEHALVVRHPRLLNRWLDKNKLKEYRYMCLQNNDIDDLPPQGLSCPELQFFLLDSKNPDLMIPGTFFQSMNALKVIRFTNMHFSSLPSSLGLLEELQSLCLHSCVLEDIAEVGNLKSLLVLSLADSDIKRLPWELSQLTKLQMLNLAGCSKLKVIPPKLLSNLKRLEVLDMRESFKQWEAEGNGNANVDELKHLTNLSSLTIEIPDASVLSKDLFKDMPLEKYEILIGKELYWWRRWSNEYRTTLNINSIHLNDGIRKLFENVEVLNLKDVKGKSKVLCDLHGREFLKLKRLQIRESYQFDYVISNSSVASFSQLVKIVIEDSKSIEAFVVSTQQNSVSSNEVIVFHQWHTLKMSDLPKLLTFYLEENATNNERNKESKSLFNSKVSFPKLERMELKRLNRLIPSIWDDQLPQKSFSNLKTLIVESCGFVERLIPFHVLKSLSNLEELEVSYCESLEMVFDFEELNNQEIQLSWTVPLRKLKLNRLPKLKHVWSNDSQEMEFFHEKVVQNLKELELDGEFAKMIWNAQFLPGNLFQSVQQLSLTLDGSVSFAKGLDNNRFPNLQELKLSGWVKELIFMPLLIDVVAPSKLTTLVLEFVNCLKHIWNEHSQQNSFLQNIQTLQVSGADLINLGTSFIPFTNLTDIHVSHSGRLTSLMTPSTSRSLVQLTRLTIIDCGEIEEIIRKQEGEEEDDVEKEIVFQKLQSLTLERLQRLRSFCGHNYTLRFPSLEKVIISRCGRMSMFCPGDLQTPSLKCVTYYDIKDEKLVDNNLNTTIHHLVSSQVSFTERMSINDSNDLNLWIWNDQFSQNYKFDNLKTLVVERCGFVERLIPFRVLKSLSNLEEVEVYYCESLEMVFDIEEVNNHEKAIHQLPWVVPLKKLKLERLPKLKHVWSNDPQEMVSFHSLQEVKALSCGELESMFPASIAKRGLLQLEKLTIEHCGIHVIVAKDEVSESHNATLFVFPELIYLTFRGLHNLTNFYPSRHILEWPKLQELYVSICDKLEMFQKQVSSTSILEDEEHDTCLLFFQEKIVHNLKRLDLDGKLAMTIWNGQFPEKLFQNVLHLSLKLDGSSVSFANGLCNDRLPNLQELNLSGGWVKELMPLLVDVAPLTSLVLHDVQCLKHIWNEQSQKNSLLQNIQTLQVSWCGDLINLGTSSFINLTDIEVKFCRKLSSLLTSTASRSLVQLTRLRIAGCRQVEEIIRKQEDDVEKEIVFQKLESLTLEKLPRLRSFCSHNYTFKFPSLEEVIIDKCESMSMFCAGDIDTPSLGGVQYGSKWIEWEYEKLVDNNLNTKIQQSFLAKVTILELYPEMRNIWMEKLPHHHMPFSRLEDLIVDNCDFLSEYVIPTHLIRFLSNLKVLEVRNCHAIKTIFDLKGTDLDEETHKLLATIRLEELYLHNLANLKCVWTQDHLEGSNLFQNLRELYVSECESLRNIFVASIAKGLGQLESLSIISCGVEMIIAKDETSKESPNFVFPQLSYLELDKLSNLKCFYPERCTFEWPRLTTLFVSQCENLNVFGTKMTNITESNRNDEVPALFVAEKVIPKLKSLSLSQKDTVNFERNGQFQAELFHEVKTLCLESFVGESIAFPYDFLGRFPNLNKLNVNHSSFEGIFPSQVQHVDDMGDIAPFYELNLAYLDQLKTIWNDDVESQLPPLSQNLGRLKVECCCSLIKLIPSSASLENLRELEVFGCHQLTYLVTISTAKSLVNLGWLKITDCEKMEEIIKNENKDAEGAITFNELLSLELTNLPMLKSFCSENQSFKFPDLEYLTIKGCHQMKMFCHGVVETPKLRGLKTEEGRTPLEVDLNKTIELSISDKDG